MFSVVRCLLLGSFLLITQIACAVEPKRDDETELADSKRISTWEINEFHQRFIALCMKDLPEEVTVQYLGTVATDNGRLKQQVDDADGQRESFLLSWRVVRDVGLFDFWISTKKTTATVSQCQIDGRTLHLNVSFVDDDRDVKAPLAALGGASVHDVLQKMALPYPPVPAKRER